MSSTPTPVPPQIERLQQRALLAGGVGIAACLAGAFASPDQFFRSYLFGYLFWAGVAIGCLSLSMIHHLSGGGWGLPIRRFHEAAARTLPLLALLFVPVLVGLPRLYVWARPEEVAKDPILRMKSPYLNSGFFIGRFVFYFAVWAVFAHLLSKWSLERDAKAGDVRLGRRLRGLSGGGLVVMGLTITFAAVDWGMSLNPHWFSTVYGILFMVGQALSAMALTIALLAHLGGEEPLKRAVSPQVFHDLGKLLFAFVMLWAYISVSQLIIVWSGNLPEEIPWYLARLSGGWQYLALVLVLFHFALPFLLLLSRDLKRNAGLLAAVATGILCVRLVDLYWLIAPDLQGHGAHGLHVHWLDLAAPLGLGGLWLAAFAWQLKGQPLLPTGDPELMELLGERH